MNATNRRECLWPLVTIRTLLFLSGVMSLSFNSALEIDYSGYEVLNISTNPYNIIEWSNLHSFTDYLLINSSDKTQALYISFENIVVLLSETSSTLAKDYSTKNNLHTQILSTDVQSLIKRVNEENEVVRRTKSSWVQNGGDDYIPDDVINVYPELVQIYAWYFKLKRKFSSFVDVIEIGKSYENRSIYCIKLENKQHMVKQKPTILVVATVKGLEWITMASSLSLIYEVLRSHVLQDKHKEFSNSVKWYIIPVVNPDSYVLTKEDRYWVKTTSSQSPTETKEGVPDCIGVDLDRNFDFMWNLTGNNDSCSYRYRGYEPFSEKESIALRDFIMAYNKSIKAFFVLHGFSQNILYSSSNYSIRKKELDHKLQIIGAEMATAINKNNKNSSYYKTPHAPLMQGGSIQDWARHRANIYYSFTIELGIKGKDHVLPISYIPQVSADLYTGMRTAARKLLTSINEDKRKIGLNMRHWLYVLIVALGLAVLIATLIAMLYICRNKHSEKMKSAKTTERVSGTRTSSLTTTTSSVGGPGVLVGKRSSVLKHVDMQRRPTSPHSSIPSRGSHESVKFRGSHESVHFRPKLYSLIGSVDHSPIVESNSETIGSVDKVKMNRVLPALERNVTDSPDSNKSYVSTDTTLKDLNEK